MAALRVKVIVGPTKVAGSLGRMVEFPDGRVITQIWTGSRWVTDRTKVVSVLKGKRAGKDTMASFNLPESDKTPGELP
ncbi:MAG TPA: hypothetical protein VJ085_03045 [Candidatus Acidoferrales bacterium]|nr:hypothetical protein [Candidatus Acidoferrales bacterium]